MGWRLDYFIASKVLMPYVVDSLIFDEVKGSDHCPIKLELDLTGESYTKRKIQEKEQAENPEVLNDENKNK